MWTDMLGSFIGIILGFIAGEVICQNIKRNWKTESNDTTYIFNFTTIEKESEEKE